MGERRVMADGRILEKMPDGSIVQVGGGIQTEVPKPGYQYEGQKAQADAAKASNQATASQYDPALAAAELVAKQAQAAAAQRQAGTASSAEDRASTTFAQEQQGGINTLNLLKQGIDNIDKIYNNSFKGKGLRSIAESYSPDQWRPANPALNTAANSLSSTVARALQLTGQQFNTPAEAQMFIGGMLPKNDDPDEVIVDKILRLKNVYENAARTASVGSGQEYSPRYDIETGALVQNDREKAVDATQRRMVDGQGGGVKPSDSGFETVLDPNRAGINDEVLGMVLGGASTADIAQYIKSRGVNPLPMMGAIEENVKLQRTNPGVKPYIQIEQISRPLSSIDQFRNDITDNPVGAAAVGGGNMLTAGYLDEIKGGTTQQDKEYLRAQYPGATFGGEMAGGLAAMLPIGRGVQAGSKALGLKTLGESAVKAGLAGDVAYGAALGSGENNENRALGAGTGAVAAGIGNKLGGALVSGAGRAVRGVSDPVVQRLSQAKIPLSLGQLLGRKGAAGRMVNKMESTPIVGDMLNSRRVDANEAVFGRTLQDAVDPIGGQVTSGGIDGLSQAQGLKKQAYGDALSGVNAPIDAQYISDVAGPIRAGRALPGQYGEEFGAAVEQRLRPPFGQNRTLEGPDAQQFLQETGDFASSFQDGKAFGNIAADHMRGIGGATEDLIARTNPGSIDALKAANASHSRLVPIENAAITANGNIPTPLQLRRAITSNTKKFGGRSTAATGGQVPQIVDDAAQVLPSNVPNSGTADRLAALALPATLGGGAIGMQTLSDNPGTSGILGLLAAMSTKKGAAVTQAALTRRPEALKQLGEEIVRRKRIGGIFGAPAMLSLAPR